MHVLRAKLSPPFVDLCSLRASQTSSSVPFQHQPWGPDTCWHPRVRKHTHAEHLSESPARNCCGGSEESPRTISPTDFCGVCRSRYFYGSDRSLPCVQCNCSCKYRHTNDNSKSWACSRLHSVQLASLNRGAHHTIPVRRKRLLFLQGSGLLSVWLERHNPQNPNIKRNGFRRISVLDVAAASLGFTDSSCTPSCRIFSKYIQI